MLSSVSELLPDDGIALLIAPVKGQARIRVKVEEYAKELLVFGTNQVEFAHIDYTRGDQYKLVAWSAILDKYDLRVSVFNVPFQTAVWKRFLYHFVLKRRALTKTGSGQT